MSVVAKFQCDRVEATYTKDSAEYSVRLTPVVGDSEENETFYKFTPAGAIELTILNEEAGNQFLPGKSYFVRFTEADE